MTVAEPVAALARAVAARLAKVVPEGFGVEVDGRRLTFGPTGTMDRALDLPEDVVAAGLDQPHLLASWLDGVLADVQDAVFAYQGKPWPDWFERPGAGPNTKVVRDGVHLAYGDQADCLPLAPIVLRPLGWPPLRWDDESTDDPFATAVEQYLAERLLQDGWTVEVDRHVFRHGVSARLEHPLVGSMIHGITEAEDWQQDVDRRLDDFAFRSVRERPDDMPHFELVGSIRSAPGPHYHELARAWFGCLAWRLYDGGAITHDECLWLCWAGPSWARTDPPARTFAEYLAGGDDDEPLA